ncbi:MAG: carboxypeptidase-like regulatory domain-containing protein [Bacteroidales bacterium]|nr:carboxypeptidase-like regulatory domain-containing protein [Bacteroidales bacterium]
MKHLVFTFSLFLLGLTSHSQISIQGKVTDSKGVPLVGASVFLPEQNKGTICNSEGIYIIENVPNGRIIVQCSYLGYNPTIKSLNIQPGKNELNVSLTLTTLEMSEVLVVSGGIPPSQKDNAIKIESLTSKDIQLAGTPNLMEALAEVPGVEIISGGQGTSKPVIRGLSMNGVLVTRDGVRIENYQYSIGHPVGVDDNGTEKVEVIKGPASLL